LAVGKGIRQVREAKGVQGAVLAEQVGVSPNTIYRIEANDRTPSLDLLERIAEELGVSPAEFFKGDSLLEEEHPSRTGLLGRPEVRDWLVSKGATFLLMSDEEFEATVLETRTQSSLEDLLGALMAERRKVEELFTPRSHVRVRREVFPYEEASVEGTLRSHKNAYLLRGEITREYSIKEAKLSNYIGDLFDDALVRLSDTARREIYQGISRR
jgi:transcriptional regulator with XRE-family HTH domain